MIFKGKEIKELTFKELQAADWELAGVEENYLQSLQHPKFEKMKPKPEMNPSFKTLRNEIKNQMNKFDKAGLYIEKEDK